VIKGFMSVVEYEAIVKEISLKAFGCSTFLSFRFYAYWLK